MGDGISSKLNIPKMANTEEDSPQGEERSDPSSTKGETPLDGSSEEGAHADKGSKTLGESDTSSNDENKTADDSNPEVPSSTNSVDSGAPDELSTEGGDADASADASPSASSTVNNECSQDKVQDVIKDDESSKSSFDLLLTLVSDSDVLDKGKDSDSGQDSKLLLGDQSEKKEVPDSTEQALFSDDEDSVYLSPENKLVEVILQEGDDESGTNLDAFIPEVQCSVEEPEGNGFTDGDNLSEKGCDLGLVIGGVVSSFNEDEIMDGDGLMAGDEGIILNAEEDVSIDNDENSALDNDGMSQPGPSDPEDVQRTYIADFYSDASNIVPETEVSGSEEGKKGLSLYRFPKIVKNLASADYSLLQELYKLIYIRNPWDTMEILSQRILDFSGFSFTQGSEDYFTRHVMLQTMPLHTLKSVAALLCLDCSKNRQGLETRIMEFLHAPHRPTRQSISKQKASSKGAPARSKSSPGNVNKRRSRKRKSSLPKPEPCSKSVKLSVPKSGGSVNSENEEIEIIEDSLEKEDSSNAETGLDIKMKLKRTSTRSFCLVPADETPESKNKSDLDEDENAESNYVSEKNEKNSDSKQKLQDFPEIVSNIEGTPDKILKEIHYLLFLEDCDLDVLKENILKFDGFTTEEGSRSYELRKIFLEKMQNSVIKNILDTFYLTNQSDKDENIDVILEFLKAPDRDLMKKAAEAPDMLLLNSKMKVDGLSDSDDSISFEIVTKKVDCIDLISSGEEDEEDEKPEKPEMKREPTPPPVEDNTPKKRTLRNFETITKIVNTHPNEYLVDIYNLLYMLPSDPHMIRKEILDFSGFEFEKGTPEYVRRKQFLDRMQYNSVRRIFNTLIHNTREVRVFSKPTMIADVFQFLFKLPDTDTSIRQPLPKPNPLPSTSSQGLSMASLALLKSSHGSSSSSNNNNSSGLAAVNAILNQSTAKLSELKRVFQRVACFPCEYLIDVHKLLFMKDCDMTEIRQRIFSFKGFQFGVNSSEFKQRKMYLEYLTFHSLRKISSVLTTKNVDLRNSTKHELASHLTKVLMEYTDMKPSDVDFDPKEAIQVDSNPKPAAAAAKDSNVEKIVVMPVIDSYTGGSESTPVSTAPKVIHLQPEQRSQPTFERIITPSVLQSQVKAQSENKPQAPKVNRRKKSSTPVTVKNNMSGIDPTSTMQFQDIHLPEVEKLVRNYQQGPPQLRDLRPKNIMNNAAAPNFLDVVRCNYQSIIDQHIRHPPPYPVAISMPRPVHPVPFQIVPPFQAQTAMPNLYFPTAPPVIRPMEVLTKDDEMGGCSETVPVECILTEEPDSGEPAAKKPFLAQLVGSFPYHHSYPEPYLSSLTGSKASSLALASKGSTNTLQTVLPKQPTKTSSLMTPQEESLHMKIRDAMTKGSEDEEDCDKPLATLVGHPNDKMLKQQICEIVENTNLQDITINGVIQKIFNMYPKYNLNYRKEFIKSTLRSLLYRLGEEDSSKTDSSAKSPDSSVSTTNPSDSFSEAAPSISVTPPISSEAWNKMNNITALKKQKS